MVKDKEKTSTAVKFAVRVGGLVLSLPVVLFSLLILLIGFIGAVITLGWVFWTGYAATQLELLALLSIGIAAGIAHGILLRATIRYVGGIGALFERLRGLQSERARVERLIEHPSTPDEGVVQLAEYESAQRQSQSQI